MDQAFGPLLAFIVSQLVIIGLGLIPTRYWRGIQARAKRSGLAQVQPALAQSGER
jgi:hypothetical protein